MWHDFSLSTQKKVVVVVKVSFYEPSAPSSLFPTALGKLEQHKRDRDIPLRLIAEQVVATRESEWYYTSKYLLSL